MKLRRLYLMSALMAMLAITITACAGGLVGSKAEKLAYFEGLETETLAQLMKEQPGAEQELARSVGYAVIEKRVVKVPVIGAGGGAGVVVETASGKKSYLRVPELQFGLGWGGRSEKVILIFQDIEKIRSLADGMWKAGIVAEAAAKAGDIGAAGGRGTGELMKKGFTTYVLTDAGVSATATIAVLRAQPYSID